MSTGQRLVAVVLGLGICGTSVYAGNWNFTCYNSAGKIDAKHIRITATYNTNATTEITQKKGPGIATYPINVNSGTTWTGKPGVLFLIENTDTGESDSFTLHGNFPTGTQNIHVFIPQARVTSTPTYVFPVVECAPAPVVCGSAPGYYPAKRVRCWRR